MAASIDTAYVASYCSTPESSIETLISSPTPELVAAFLQSLVARAQEHEALKSDQLRRDVELENAVRGGEAKARVLKANAEKAQEQVNSLRKQLNDEESARAQLQIDLDSLRSSTSTSTTETENLRAQVSRLEYSKRDTLALLDSKTTAYDKLAEELSNSQQKAIEYRRKVADLEDKQSQTNNAVNSAKFKQSSLQQEIDLLKRNNDWLDNELKSKSAEYAKFRKEKNARVSELQRANEDANTNISSLQRTENTLRGRIDELGRKSEEHLMTIQRIQEEKLRLEEGFRAEVDGVRRLAQLQEQSAQTARRRVEELDEEIEKTRAEASEEISTMQSEVETERQAKEVAEQKAEELELQIETLHANASNTQGQGDDTGVATPRRGQQATGPFGTPMRSASPAAFGTPSSKFRNSTSMTQLVSDLNKTKAELEDERRRHARLNTTFEELMADLEAKAPEIQDLHEDKARLEADITQISTALNEAQHDRDSYKKDCRKWESQAHGLVREADLLRQQLRDLSLQVKVLTVEVQIRSEGVQLSHAERQALQRAASGESDERVLEGMTDTGRYISQHLTIFRNAFELQEQNEKLLRVTRQLGEEMEGEEAKAKNQAHKKTEDELDALRAKTEQYKVQLGELQKQTKSFMKERDTYRRMCAHRGKIPQDADLDSMFDETINGIASPSKGPPNGSVNGNAPTHDLAAESRLLKEMQLHFDAYKREAATDHETLRNQITGLAREKGSLQGDLDRAKSQVSIASERYQMLQDNYNMLRTECEELQKRSQSYAEAAAKQDAKTQQALEDLIQQRELENGLRGENANLKAERDLSKRMQDRLEEDNKSLYQERDRLNNLIVNTQKLSSERETSFEEQRRRLQGQVDSLETENRTVKQRLDEEIESSKNASLRREYDSEQNQTRINDLMKDLSTTKEELTAAKTMRDQLQARVEELKIELRTAQEHAQALQRRPTTRPGTAAAHQDEASLSREQELSIEVADLRRELELAKNELGNAKEQIEQYKGISAASEEALNETQSNFEEYQDDAEKLSREKASTIHDLEQRRDEITNELSTTNEQLAELQTKAASHQADIDRQKADYEAQLQSLKDENDRNRTTAEFRQEDVKEQAAIARRAQENYEAELIKHGNAAKNLQDVRGELNEIKLQVSTAKAEADTARAQLQQSEEIWASTREQLEVEVTELKRRREDVDRQNQLLHQQLETVNSQITEMQQRRQAGHAGAEEAEDSSEPDVQKYSEIIKYLRREKEIVDVQYELSLQESRRLKQQLDHSESELNDARLRLEQERQRQQGQQSYSKLAETINQLNVFRESNETLRGEARHAQAQLAEKSKKVDELNAEIGPLKASLSELENQYETSQGELKLAQEDRDRWQKRNQDILSKYDRVDPAEMQELRDKLSALESEKTQTISEKDALTERVNGFEQELEQAKEQSKKETLQKAREQFVAKVKDLSGKINTANTEKQGIQEQLDQTRTQLAQAQEELSQAQGARDAAQNEARLAQEQVRNPPAQTAATQTSPPPPADAPATTTANRSGSEEGELGDDSAERLQEDQSQVQQKSEQIIELEKAVNELEDQVQTLQTQNEELQTQLDTERAQVQNLQQNQPQAPDASATGNEESNEHMQKLQDDLAAAQQELEALRQNAQAPQDSTQNAQDNATDISTLRTQLEAEFQQKTTELDQSFKDRVKEMKDKLNGRLRDTKQNIEDAAKQAVRTEYEATVAQLKQEHESTVSDLKAQHAEEMETKAAPPAEEKAAPQAKGADDVTDLPSEPDAVKKFVANNPTVKGMVTRTVQTRFEEERVAFRKQMSDLETSHKNEIANLEAAHVAKLKELEEHTEKAKSQAVALAEKKSTVKLNMAIKARDDAKAKIDYVQKSASETPTKPVSEVWEVAKTTKPQATQQPVQIQTPGAAAASAGRATPQPQPTRPIVKKEDLQDRANGGSSDMTQQSQAPPHQTSSVPATPTPQQQPVPTTQAESAQAPNAQQQASALPRPGSAMGIRGQARRLSNASQTHAQQQASQSTEQGDSTHKLPNKPLTSGIARGTGIPRGGSIRGRGGVRGGMNPGAGSFTPGAAAQAGQKRGFEGDQSRGGGNDKRARGGRGG